MESGDIRGKKTEIPENVRIFLEIVPLSILSAIVFMYYSTVIAGELEWSAFPCKTIESRAFLFGRF